MCARCLSEGAIIPSWMMIEHQTRAVDEKRIKKEKKKEMTMVGRAMKSVYRWNFLSSLSTTYFSFFLTYFFVSAIKKTSIVDQNLFFHAKGCLIFGIKITFTLRYLYTKIDAANTAVKSSLGVFEHIVNTKKDRILCQPSRT